MPDSIVDAYVRADAAMNDVMLTASLLIRYPYQPDEFIEPDCVVFEAQIVADCASLVRQISLMHTNLQIMVGRYNNGWTTAGSAIYQYADIICALGRQLHDLYEGYTLNLYEVHRPGPFNS